MPQHSGISLRAIQFYNAWRGYFYRPSAVQALGYDQPPTDWDEFMAFGKAAREAGYDYAVMFPATNGRTTLNYLSQVYFGLGGEIFNEGKPVFYESPNREILSGCWACGAN